MSNGIGAAERSSYPSVRSTRSIASPLSLNRLATSVLRIRASGRSARRMLPYSSRGISTPAISRRSSTLSLLAIPSAIIATPSGRPETLRFKIAPSRTSHASDRLIVGLRNSSGIRVIVAAEALPIPSAKCPVCRPIATMKYHRFVVRESSLRFITIPAPTCRAVSYPKVGIPPGKGRSLSIVLGTCATRISPLAFLAISLAPNDVSSPPMVIK